MKKDVRIIDKPRLNDRAMLKRTSHPNRDFDRSTEHWICTLEENAEKSSFEFRSQSKSLTNATAEHPSSMIATRNIA